MWRAGNVSEGKRDLLASAQLEARCRHCWSFRCHSTIWSSLNSFNGLPDFERKQSTTHSDSCQMFIAFIRRSSSASRCRCLELLSRFIAVCSFLSSQFILTDQHNSSGRWLEQFHGIDSSSPCSIVCLHIQRDGSSTAITIISCPPNHSRTKWLVGWFVGRNELKYGVAVSLSTVRSEHGRT